MVLKTTSNCLSPLGHPPAAIPWGELRTGFLSKYSIVTILYICKRAAGCFIKKKRKTITVKRLHKASVQVSVIPARAPAVSCPVALGRLGSAPPLRCHCPGRRGAGSNAGSAASPGRAPRELARDQRGRGRGATRSAVDLRSGGQA